MQTQAAREVALVDSGQKHVGDHELYPEEQGGISKMAESV